MAIRLTKSQAKQFGVQFIKASQKKKTLRGDGYQSQLEADYAQSLMRQELDGLLKRWVYEPLRFLLAHKTTYVPDFLVEPKQGKLEMHEVKGYFYEKDRIKVKMTARLFPMFRFIVVRQVNGLWDFEEFPP